MSDISAYSIIIPVLPFRLEALGYSGVSSLVGWLLFAFVCIHRHASRIIKAYYFSVSKSGGLVVSTIPVAMLSERYKTRRVPFIIGTVTLLGSQVMLMEAPSYGIMCFARILQGISSSMVWVVGLALL
jgi:DHA1 family solute carrier family 18 vesicular amine transporter 1/2